MRCCVNLVLVGRRFVIGLPAVSLVAPPSPVQLNPSRVIVDRVARTNYMQDWQAQAKLRRLDDRAKAILTPRRSLRIASKTV